MTTSLQLLAEVSHPYLSRPVGSTQVRPGDPIRMLKPNSEEAWPLEDPRVTGLMPSLAVAFFKDKRGVQGVVNMAKMKWINGAWQFDNEDMRKKVGPERIGAMGFRGEIGRGIGEAKRQLARKSVPGTYCGTLPVEERMSRLEALRNLVTEGKPPPPDVEHESPYKSASKYIGDVLDLMMSSGFMTKEEIDDAASIVADYAEEGPEAVVKELIRKGLVKGSKLLNGGHRKLRSRVVATMAEWLTTESIREELSEGKLTERQRKMKENVESNLREVLQRHLVKEGYSPLAVNQILASIGGRLRGMTMKMIREGSKRSLRPDSVQG